MCLKTWREDNNIVNDSKEVGKMTQRGQGGEPRLERGRGDFYSRVEEK